MIGLLPIGNWDLNLWDLAWWLLRGMPHHGQGVPGRAETFWLPRTIPCPVPNGLGLVWGQVTALVLNSLFWCLLHTWNTQTEHWFWQRETRPDMGTKWRVSEVEEAPWPGWLYIVTRKLVFSCLSPSQIQVGDSWIESWMTFFNAISHTWNINGFCQMLDFLLSSHIPVNVNLH